MDKILWSMSLAYHVCLVKLIVCQEFFYLVLHDQQLVPGRAIHEAGLRNGQIKVNKVKCFL